MGGDWVEAMDRKEIEEFIPYKLSWNCLRWAGREENAGDSPKFIFSVAFSPGEPAKTRPLAANPALPQASMFTAGDSHRRGVHDPFGRDFEQALKIFPLCP
jgi:hypothetical protein